MEDLISKFLSLGANEKSAVLASQVLLELCEVKKYWNIEYEYDQNTGKIIVRAKKTASEPHSVFIPISSYEELSFNKIDDYLNIYKVNRAFLAIVHPDSTCIYYEITKGLSEPNDTTAKHSRVNKQEKLDSELRKHQKTIEQAALYGLPVTIIDKGQSSAENNI
ncbi:tRNA splicing endonuclease subunit 15 [Rhynchophorus ferrugineus]|uniref:tRNA splicing endonuclease subunit 15 n=1 Tax=Rhynchophorus ferrugineus TaxID=354439 RepID=UPI003FCEAB42